MIKYILLGILQGLTEFLPVSSSGHLIILQEILGIEGRELAVSLVLHLGTTFALMIFFFKDIIAAFRDAKLLSFIAVVSFITGAIGFFRKEFF